MAANPIPPGHARLWTRPVADVDDPAVPAAVLTSAEQQQWSRYRRSVDRNLFHASRVLQHEVGHRLLGHPVVIDRRCARCGEQHGRPGWLGAGELDYSVSHSGNVVVMIVVNGGRVGIDVEQSRSPQRGFGRWRGMAANVLTPAEAQMLERSSSGTAEREFLRLWCRKEAVVKLTGQGLLAELTAIDVLGESTPAPDTGTLLWLHDLLLPADYIGAVASTIPDLTIQPA